MSIEILFLSKENVDSLNLSSLTDIMGRHRAWIEGSWASKKSSCPPKTTSPSTTPKKLFNILKGYVEPEKRRRRQGHWRFPPKTTNTIYPPNWPLSPFTAPKLGPPSPLSTAPSITWMRTGAVTAVGAKYLANEKPRVLGHIGARGTAWYNVPMLDQLFDFEEIRGN